jgi:hypothetical protein
MDGINKEVGIIKNVLEPHHFDRLRTHFKNNPYLADMPTDEFGRKLIGDSDPILKEYSEMLLPKVREYFNTETCVPSYSLFAEYCDEVVSLHKHKDLNACTYTLDLTLYQLDPWALYVDGKPYTANPNEAVMFMGEEFEHWRETLYTNSGRIGVVFFHYVEPDHWYFTKGPNHIYEIYKQKQNEIGDHNDNQS